MNGPRKKRLGRPWLAVVAVMMTAAMASALEAPRLFPLIMESSGRLISLRVEVADTRALRLRGLMFRQRLPAGQGMLLLWKRAGMVALWMKNTRIPLDMVFMDAAGRVIHVHEHARPGDLTPISAGKPTRAVLEIAAGEARRLGLKPGDRAALPR